MPLDLATWRTRLPGAAVLLLIAGCSGQAAAPAHAPSVEVATVLARDVSLTSEWVATLDGYVNAQIQPQVSGYLVRQTYKEGSFVHQNDVLFEIDPRPFEATLDQARAQLMAAQAQLANAQLNVKRDIPEAKENAIPQMQLETDQHAMMAAEAAVEAGRAAVKQAELNLGFTKVRSLINGIAGIAQVQVGNLVGPQAVLTSVSQVDPLKVYFPVTSDEYLQMMPPDEEGRPHEDIPLQLVLGNGRPFGHPGKLLFADRQVEQQTGTIRLVGAFPNPGNVLRPGLYGRVRAVTQERKAALLVPQRAVTELQGAEQVAVVGADNKVSIRTVHVGERIGSQWIILDGLKAGERVIAEGTQAAQEGALVTPVAYQQQASAR